MTEQAPPDTLHIHAQCWWHDEAWVVGNEEALRNLVRALKRAIKEGYAEYLTFTADGEGYDVRILRLNDDALWDKARLPYTAEWAQDKCPDALHPEDLVRRAQPSGWRRAERRRLRRLKEA